MELNNVIQELQKRLPSQRFQHVLRVTETAKSLALLHDVSVEQAEIAALFHDFAKSMEGNEMRRVLESRQEDQELFNFHKELWHAPVGAIIAQEEFGIEDEDILHAIRYHTTGRAGMSDLEMVVYIADMIEPGRDFPGVDVLREVVTQKSLSTAMRFSIIHSVEHLIGKRVPVYPDSIACYNYFVK